MIRMYYHFRVPENREEEGEAKLKEWVDRMVGAKGFKGAVIMEEFHHFADHSKFHTFALNHDWEARDDFREFWAKNGQHYPVPSGHPWLAHYQEGDSGHSHGEEHHHDKGEKLFDELFHGHYEVVYQVP